MKKIHLPLFLLSWIIFSNSIGQVSQINYQNTFGGNSRDFFADFEFSNNNILIGGSSSSGISGNKTIHTRGAFDYWIILTDTLYNQIWQQVYGGNNDDRLVEIIKTNDGGYILAGYSNSAIGGEKSINTFGGYDYWIIKINAQGDIIWQKVYGGTNSELLHMAKQTADGNFILVGTSNSGISGNKTTVNNGGNDYWIIKIDNLGNEIWQKSYGGSNSDEARDIIELNDGNFLIAGASNSNISGDKNEDSRGFYDYWILKISESGNIIWQKTIGGNEVDQLMAINLINNNEFILSGYSLSEISGEKNENCRGGYDYWVVKINSNGDIINQKTIGGSNSDIVRSVETNNNNIIISGYSSSGISNEKIIINKGGEDYWLVILNENLNLVFQDSKGCSGDDRLMKSKVISNNLYIGGYSLSTTCDDKTSPSFVFEDFWLLKITPINNPIKISGKIHLDSINTCNSIGVIPGIILKTNPRSYFTISDYQGNYTIYADTGDYNIKPIPRNSQRRYINQNCPSINNIVSCSYYGQEINNYDYYLDLINCHLLSININSNRRRRCFTNSTSISYRNEGILTAENVEVKVKFPKYVHFLSASHNYTFNQFDSTYVFPVGNLVPNSFGYINIIDSVACFDDIRGLTQCTKAWITPTNQCFRDLDTLGTGWDKSSVSVTGACISDSIVRFVIYNTGSSSNGNMTAPSFYRVYKNGMFAFSNSFQIAGGDSLAILVPTSGETIRLEADQRPGHPGNSRPNETIEGCGGTFVANRFNNFPQDDADLEIEIDCLPIIDSYDPNDKQIFPSGIGQNKVVFPKTQLEFVIRFQNTGTDTAYSVVVVDTISSHLDIATFEYGTSSFPYNFKLSGEGKPVLTFTFNNINLPDSSTNELASNGFISFKISPYDTIALGTIIENFADIYFDYNYPIRTNTTTITINDLSSITSINQVNNQKKILKNLKIYPNPASNQVTISSNKLAIGTNVEIFNMMGIKILDVLNKNLDSDLVLNISYLSKGIYFVKVGDETAKMVVE
jgi:uncharacterized repeat protein (TIGR01451 family)